ncbi:penicillin-binding protein [Pseudomonas sp. HMWF032]|uniref:DUF4124 domain-containing protein n=1 Tax=unclassified Pseudomonas TaxID=196821 RepID=UPI000D33F738|nr:MULTISPECIES: DUF4124 domain-containing protein [unclassified Pseudomonas]PTS82067.1 penicillin-binding protein [Pseudomonas sp. HMWF032]PTT80654.1 penicillin-binding protein [Pseudomonas sp. HMWF010]WAC45805.1 DUF4124 domain-containing protein [Pseudomonas sp. SL4(2022)]
MRTLLLCGLLLLALPTLAQVYTYIDADGNRVFTDKPKSGNAERVELVPSNAMPAQPASAAPVIAAPPEPALRYNLLRILVPQPDATIRDAAGNLIVSVNSEPDLHPQHSYRLLLDGEQVGEVGSSPVFPLENIDRGTHQLAVEIIDAQGRIIERTPSQPFHMLRISLAQKRMVTPCKKADYGVRPECPLKDKPPEKKDIPFVPFL